MGFNENINLFTLTDKLVDRFREESGFQLTGYEFELKIWRDWQCPVKRIRFALFIYGEDYAYASFDEKCDTEDKVVDSLVVNLLDDTVFANMEHCLVMTLICFYENKLEELTEKITAFSKELVEPRGYGPLIVCVDEKLAPSAYYENGIPVMQYRVCEGNLERELVFDLPYLLRGFSEEAVFEAVKKAAGFQE